MNTVCGKLDNSGKELTNGPENILKGCYSIYLDNPKEFFEN